MSLSTEYSAAFLSLRYPSLGSNQEKKSSASNKQFCLERPKVVVDPCDILDYQ